MPLFDPDKEKAGAGLIWVRIPSFPIHFWTDSLFKSIRDDLGTYLDHDRSFLDTGNISMAKILVFLDTRDGLHEAYNIHFENM